MYHRKPYLTLFLSFNLFFLPLIHFSVDIPSISTDQEVINSSREFWAFNFISKEYYTVNANLLTTGECCYIFMEEECISKLGESSVMAKVQDISDEFDNVIYPRIIDLAGHPNGTMGDIDGDPKVYILFLDSANYYSEANDIEHNISNHCEMFYIHYRLYHHFWLYPTMAHEFHHLIWFNNEWGEPPFTLEALAQYSTYHAGYLNPYQNLVPQVASYLPHPENSPLYWNNDEDYGSSYLFAFYLAEKYGTQVLRDLITEPSNGPEGIEAVLQSAGYDITFNELYLNWLVALTIDELGFENNLYGFEGLDAQISSFTPIYELPIVNQSFSCNHYAFKVFKFQTNVDNFTITVEKSPDEVIGAALVIHDTFGWFVKKKLLYDALGTISFSSLGTPVDEAYLIVSFFSKDTPTIPEERERGTGPSIETQISITEGVERDEVASSNPPATNSSTNGTTMKNKTTDFPELLLILLMMIISLVVFTSKTVDDNIPK